MYLGPARLSPTSFVTESLAGKQERMASHPLHLGGGGGGVGVWGGGGGRMCCSSHVSGHLFIYTSICLFIYRNRAPPCSRTGAGKSRRRERKHPPNGAFSSEQLGGNVQGAGPGVRASPRLSSPLLASPPLASPRLVCCLWHRSPAIRRFLSGRAGALAD